MSGELPTPPTPRGRYRAALVVGSLVHSAGMTPRRDGRLVVRGRLGAELDVAAGAAAAGVAAGNALAACAAAVGGLAGLDRCVRMTVYVAAAPGFTELSAVADGASAALAEQVGEEALPVRAAVGVLALPDGAPVEVELTAAAR